MVKDHRTYQDYAIEKIEALNGIFARAAIGDFSQNIELPDEEDIFLQLYVGVQTMLEVMRSQVKELQTLNQALENKVQERTLRLVEAQRLAHIGNWSWHLETNRLLWSEELYRIYGLAKEEFTPTYEGFFERIHPDDRVLTHEKIDYALRHHAPFEFDHRIIFPGGGIRVIHTRGEVIHASRGSGTTLVGTSQDITARVQAENKFRGLIESAPDALVISNSKGTILMVNYQAETLFGYSKTEMIGQPIEMLLPERFREKHRAQRLGFNKDPRTRPMGMGIELFARRKDGSEIPVEIGLSPLKTDEEMIVSAAIRDISKRKQTERQLQMLAHTIKSMNECVVITNLENTIISVNPATIKTYGYEEDEMISQHITMLRARENGNGLSEHILSQTLGDGYEGELFNKRKNGEEFPIFLSTSVVRDQQGIAIAMVGIARDITEQKNIQRKLEDAFRQRAEDLRHFNVSIQRAQEEERRRIARELHDGLSQRLSGIKLHLELLATEHEQSKKLSQRVTKIKRQINDMINETHRISVNLHPSALDDFGLTVALQLLFKEFESTFHIPISYYPSISTHQSFDRYIEIALYRIVQEALNNISKHSEATAITIHFTRTGEKFSLSIHDNGIGFDHTMLNMSSRNRTGLGLTSMKERAENVGGTFEITSSPRDGTILMVQIPAHQ